MRLPSDLEVQRALVHQLRKQLVLIFITNHPLSPREASRLVGVPLSTVAYHVRELVKFQFLVLQSREPVRGTLKNYYMPNEEILELPSVKELIEETGPKRSCDRGD